MSTCYLARPCSAVRLALLACFAALLTGCASTQSSKKDTDSNPFAGYSTDQILRAGDDALQAQEYDRALFIYMQALQIEETADIWYRVGITKVRLDDDAFAWKSFNQALQLNPEHTPSLEELGLLYIGFGEPAEATKVLTRATELDSTRWRAYNALGVMADVDKRYADAVNMYKAALEGKPNSAMLMNNIGYSYYLAGNLQQATNWFDAAIQAQRNYEPAIKNLALLYARQGWYEEAVETFVKVVNEARAYNDTGYVALRNGDLQDATKLLTEAIRLSPVYYEKAYENLELVREEIERLKKSEKTAALANNMSEIVFPDTHEKETRKVMPQALNVRAAPSRNSEIVEYLRTGDTVEIIVTQPGWAFINHDTPSGGTITGWVNTRFLKRGSAVAAEETPDKVSGGQAASETMADKQSNDEKPNEEQPNDAQPEQQVMVDERLDGSKPSKELVVDEKPDAAKATPASIADETPDTVDSKQQFNLGDEIDAVELAEERLIVDEKMNVVAVEVTQAYQQAASGAEKTPAP